MANSETIFGVLDNLGAVLGPVTGILLADFFVLRRLLDVPDLYRKAGRYRGWVGFNPIGLGVLAVVVAFLFASQAVPGLRWIYEFAWFTGVALAFAAYLIAGWITRSGSGPVAASMAAVGSPGADAFTPAVPSTHEAVTA